MIRELRSSDAADMAALHAESFETAWPEADMAVHIEKDSALGYIERDKLAGFVLIRMSFEQSEILTIAVGKDYQRKGLALKLLAAAYSAVKAGGGNVIFLEVAEDNPAALALYSRAGYDSFGRRPAYYKRAKGRVAARLFQKKL